MVQVGFLHFSDQQVPSLAGTATVVGRWCRHVSQNGGTGLVNDQSSSPELFQTVPCGGSGCEANFFVGIGRSSRSHKLHTHTLPAHIGVYKYGSPIIVDDSLVVVGSVST